MIRNPHLFKKKWSYNQGMRKAKGGVPSRTIDPIYVKYSALTKGKFLKLVSDVENIVKEVYKKEFSLAIEVTGFDEPFANTEDLIGELSDTDWLKQKEIDVGLYEEDEYSPTVSIRLARPNWGGGAGIKVEVLLGSTKDKLAVRESIKQLLPDYARKVYFTDKVFAVCFTITLTALFTAILYSKALTKGLTNFIYILLPVLFFVSFFGWLTTDIHSKFIIPRLEYVNDKEQTKWDKIKKFFWGAIALIGFAIAIIKFR